MSRPTALSASLPALPATDAPHASQAPASSAERQRLVQLAAEFESMLVLEMIKTMRQAMLEEEAEGEGLGADTFSSTIDTELARHLSGSGGLGLQRYMLDAWDRQREATATPPVAHSASSSVNRPRVDLPATTAVDRTGHAHDDHGPDDSHLALEITGRVSSSYGWRRDPFTGGARFHGGIDLAARYGTEVPAAADGVVVAAGEQGAYGLTVVVKHRDGYQTRYAHLSSIDVRAGDAVEQGARVGRVGSTGRSTAPHLHFEVLQGGQRIDPDRFVKNLAGDIKGQ